MFLPHGWMYVHKWKELTFSLFYGVMSKSSLSLTFLVGMLIIICFLLIYMKILESSSISMFINFV